MRRPSQVSLKKYKIVDFSQTVENRWQVYKNIVVSFSKYNSLAKLEVNSANI